MRALVTVGICLAGCAYQPGSFESLRQPFDGSRATVGCLDVAVTRRADPPAGVAVVSYVFGNRCDRPALVDLAGVDVVGRLANGHAVELTAYDPSHELAALWIDGRAVGHEAIAYRSTSPLREICVDAASIARTETVRWLCLASSSQEVP